MKTNKPNNHRSRKPPAPHQDKNKQKFEFFSFGDPIPMLDKQEVMNYTESRWNGKYYETPINLFGLAKSQHANPYHASALAVKRNLLTSMFQPHPWLGRTEFMRWVQDFLVFGNAYLERHDNARGNPIRLQCRLAKYTRRGQEADDFVMLLNQDGLYRSKSVTELESGKVFHLLQPDVNQEIYGVPEYMSVLQSAWLGESAILYRRKYYAKGHSGYILYMTDAAHEEGDVKRLREKLKSSTGLDAFRNLFMYAPNGKKDGIQIIPLADALTKDDFFNIKQATMEDVVAGHRVPMQLMAGIPRNTSGFGDAATAMEVFIQMEAIPLMNLLTALNEWLGEEVITFGKWQSSLSKD